MKLQIKRLVIDKELVDLLRRVPRRQRKVRDLIKDVIIEAGVSELRKIAQEQLDKEIKVMRFVEDSHEELSSYAETLCTQ